MTGPDTPPRALFLPERCHFTLAHCGQPMTEGRSSTTWQGSTGHGTETTTVRYLCTAGCGTTTDITVTEPA